MSCSSEENGACTSQKKYKGVRQRKWGKWVSEIRVPGTQERLWLGSYSTPEAAAMARDVAFYCLHKPSTLEKLNFPSMSPSCSLRTDMSPRSVQKAASEETPHMQGHRSLSGRRTITLWRRRWRREVGAGGATGSTAAWGEARDNSGRRDHTAAVDGYLVCPTTESTFDLRTGALKEWYPKKPVLRALTPALRNLFVYPVKTDEENIYISMKGGLSSDASAEIVFSGKAQPGITATDVNVDEIRMVVDEGQQGFGFIKKNEIIDGKAAVIGFLLLLDFELFDW
nr:ethylene-responsive transcription factor [Quercus suber]